MQTSITYLLCFSKKLHHASHYIGSTTDLDSRIADHRAGRGARLLQVITEQGISFTVARTWKDGRTFERKLKSRHNARLLCPNCKHA